MWNNKVTWSPCELEWLTANLTESVNQISLYLAKSRAAVIRKLDELSGKVSATKKNGKRTKIGKRKDIGMFFRSGWEANTARLLTHQKYQWTYESKIFSFLEHGVKHGTVSYCPDFHLNDGRILEVKGLMDKKGATAIRRFKKFYPLEFTKLCAIVGRPGTKADKFFKEMGIPIFAYYNELDKQWKKIIPYWE